MLRRIFAAVLLATVMALMISATVSAQAFTMSDPCYGIGCIK